VEKVVDDRTSIPSFSKAPTRCAARRESFSLRNMKTKYKLQSIIVDKVLNKHKSMNQAMQ